MTISNKGQGNSKGEELKIGKEKDDHFEKDKGGSGTTDKKRGRGKKSTIQKKL